MSQLSQQRIAVIDYGMGNLHSVANAVRRAAEGRCEVVVTDQASVIDSADRLVVPGQGAARDCMAALNAHHLIEPLKRNLQEKPSLGICMGLQVLLEKSDENGGTDCLGLVKGDCRAFATNLQDASGERLKVPAMGWNGVYPSQAHPLWQGIEAGSHFYFAHSYYVSLADPSLEAAHSFYPERFSSAVTTGNLFACQFHPEKSAKNGLRLLANFINWHRP